MTKLSDLLNDIAACRHCETALGFEPRPVVHAHEQAKLLIIGQAPGSKVHASGVPWDDASGDRLREWTGLTKETFYGPNVAIVPMGFCYPGKGKSGDLPPRPECAPLWHERVLGELPKVELTLLIGAYAQKHYLDQKSKSMTLTDTVKQFEQWLPTHMPLPHPSPRNNIWLKKNSWFAERALPALTQRITQLELI